MKENKLVIQINKPLHEVFVFCITPPNSTKWIPGVTGEETSEWSVKVGTAYRLTDENGIVSNVTVVVIKNDEIVEWISEDKNYHCRYTFHALKPDITELQYNEWADQGEIDGPFNMRVLEKLKKVLEKI